MSGEANTDVVFMAKGNNDLKASIETNQDLWIADSAASSNVTNKLKGMSNLKPFEGEIQVGDGSKVKVWYMGTYNGLIKDKNNNERAIKIEEVLVAFDFIGNLFSVTKALSKGAQLKNEGESIIVSKGGIDLNFDTKINSGNGYLVGCEIRPNETVNVDLNKAYKTSSNQVLPTNTMHLKLGHASEVKVRATAKMLGCKLHGIFETCGSCAEGKSQQKKTNKEAETSKERGDKLYIDLSTIKKQSYGNKHHWVLLVDDYSRQKWSIFIQKKSELPEKVFNVLNKLLNEQGVKFKVIRCDNAGENYKLQELLQEKQYGAKFEYTAPDTPQQNGVVERVFATLYGKVRSMLNWSKVEEGMRAGLWAECANTATLLDNVLIDREGEKSAHELFYGTLPKFVNHLKIFGEVGIVKNLNTKMMPKLNNKGVECIFVGYGEDHSGDMFRMFCPSTKKIRLSRNVTWLNKNYGGHKAEIDSGAVKYIYEVEENLEETTDKEKNVMEVEPEPEPEAGVRRMGPRKTEVEKLHTFYNPTMNTMSWALMSSVESDYLEPSTFEEAWNHEDPKERESWRGAIKKEFQDMESRNVWELVKEDEVPKERKPIGSKWVFKKKKNGVYRARLVALGYNQIPGIDFSDNFSPVTSDTTIKMLFVYMLKQNCYAVVIDIETAFLEGRLEETIYMKIPKGYEEYLGDCHAVVRDMILKLLGSMYGLVQASRIWYKTLVKVLIEDCNMIRCELDICLFYKFDDGPLLSVFMWMIYSVWDTRQK